MIGECSVSDSSEDSLRVFVSIHLTWRHKVSVYFQKKLELISQTTDHLISSLCSESYPKFSMWQLMEAVLSAIWTTSKRSVLIFKLLAFQPPSKYCLNSSIVAKGIIIDLEPIGSRLVVSCWVRSEPKLVPRVGVRLTGPATSKRDGKRQSSSQHDPESSGVVKGKSIIVDLMVPRFEIVSELWNHLLIRFMKTYIEGRGNSIQTIAAFI